MWLYEWERDSFPAKEGGNDVSEESRPGNSSPKKPWSFRIPPLWPLDLDAWLLAVVVTLTTDGLLSSLKNAASGESLPGAF